ncbi:Asp-tRNA(Asn)/Glu-tRNA(Gln) amidotransferase subunit GatA [Candidatus Woesearchaeota archaeon]|nr:Asp-tRNA(Asn)/Glu-tRNA(Gln) amidotransferase subunit GatA [Candidatus Woesearchaeota archaeon]
MNIQEFVKKIQNKEIDPVEHIEKVLEECRKINREYHYLNVISEELAIQQAKNLKKNPKGKLAGVAISVKDSICVQDVESTAGSRILKGYKPLFHATVVQRLINEGAVIIGKTSQDEFGFGGFSTNVGKDFEIPLNPFDKKRATGGSSGGAAGLAQKASFPHIALGESTGGSITNPASFCGVFGLSPTYGLTSRYGLIDYGNSLDKVGPLSKDVNDLSLSLDIMSGFDPKDATSIKEKLKPEEKKKLKIGIIKDSMGEGTDQAVEKAIWKKVKELEKQGIKYEEVALPITMKYGIPTYYIIATSEASSNLAKYCGMRYGMHEKLAGDFNEYFTKVRSLHFGTEAKRRILLGTFARMAGYRDAYYIKAMQVRTKIIEEYKKAFKSVDILVSSASPVLPQRFEDIKKLTPLQNYKLDALTVGPNLAGLPHLNIPVGFEKNLPIGMQIIGNHIEEKKLFALAKL